ncbi:hypothetical protein GCM10028819_19610 [Spirosoma humi]
MNSPQPNIIPVAVAKVMYATSQANKGGDTGYFFRPKLGVRKGVPYLVPTFATATVFMLISKLCLG